MPMPNRHNVDAEGYRYAYQGQEKDPETGKEAFELRLWDSRIGRWLSSDPMGQYFSPYMGMDNRPHMSIDPTGGCTVGVDCPEEFNWMDAGTFVLDEVAFGSDAVPWGTASITDGGNIDFSQASFWDWDRIDWNLTPISGSMREWKPNKAYEWKTSDNALKNMAYNFVNNTSITIQPLNPFQNNIYSLDGSTVVRGSSELQDAFVETVANFTPTARGMTKSIKGARTVKGLLHIERFSASKFSKTFYTKGLSHAKRGKFNKLFNRFVIDIYNNQFSNSVILFQSRKVHNANHNIEN